MDKLYIEFEYGTSLFYILRIFNFFVGFYVFPLRFSFGIPGDFVFFVFEFWVILGKCSGRLSRFFGLPGPRGGRKRILREK